uniref:Uncharacterized protein n=1 Tax=Nelumbo nucifera TaxID=4432 RepID=A0A822XYQ3_NELNU|nr:TPA_asm: hypothetical protein HUJ06_025795 [Nelumbo nucifera]
MNPNFQLLHRCVVMTNHFEVSPKNRSISYNHTTNFSETQ